MSNRRKGNDRENQARSIYEDAGFAVEKAVDQRWGRSDFWGLFDFMATRSDTFRLVQVKSSSASGIREMIEWAAENLPDNVEAEYAVYYKNEGWRLVRCLEDGSHTTLYDERDDPAVGPNAATEYNLGEGLAAFLGSDSV